MGLKLHEVRLFYFLLANMATFGGHFHHPLGMESLLFYAKHLPLVLSSLRNQAALGSCTKQNVAQRILKIQNLMSKISSKLSKT